MTRKKKGPPDYSVLVHEAILRTAFRKVSVRTSEGVQEFTATDVLLRQIEKTAIGGSPHAQRHMMEMIEAAVQVEQHKVETDIEQGRSFKAHQTKLRQAAIDNGEGPESILPHPDDIEIDPQRGYSIKGPINEHELKQIYHSMQFIDALILQEALEERLAERSGEEQSFGSPMIMAMTISNTLPERFRTSGAEMLNQFCRWDRLTKRELLRDCYQAWQKLRVEVPRGFIFPDIKTVALRMTTIQRTNAFIQDETDKGPTPSVRQIADAILRIQREVIEELELDPILELG